MLAVVTPEQVKAGDARALEAESLSAILDRVGRALARQVVDIMGGTYGRRINVLVGPGLNGADAAITADLLEQRGVKTRRFGLKELPGELPPADLTLDGLFGIGINRPFNAPDPGPAPVVSIDIASGIDGLTGEAVGKPFTADITLTLMALKPGLLFAAGPERSGDVRVVDIGLDPGERNLNVVQDGDIAAWLPSRGVHVHKWDNALLVVAGSTGMTGASHLVAHAATRTGAGYVQVDSTAATDDQMPTEVVARVGVGELRDDVQRFKAAVVGPGLGRSDLTSELTRHALRAVEAPLLLDGDALSVLAGDLEPLCHRKSATVLTPHDGEFERLFGTPPGADRVAAARALASATNATVLLKGATTVIADPNGRALLTNTGDARLATAGTGDVLAGMIGAFLAQGVTPLHAAAAGAYLHGRAGSLGPSVGLIASDLPDLIPVAIDGLRP